MVLTPTQDPEADFRVDQVCLDGSTGGMCGNGARSIAAFADEKLGLPKIEMVTATGERVTGFKDTEGEYAALLSVTALDADSKDRFKGIIPDQLLDDPEFIATINQQLQDQFASIDQAAVNINNPLNRVFGFVSVSGEPHLIIGLPQLKSPDDPDYSMITNIARSMNSITSKGKSVFPNEVNVSFFAPGNDSRIQIATHERGGPGVTGACGTGSVAIMSVIHELGETEALFKTPQGELGVSYANGKYTVKGTVTKL
jgi:diaminopimelate epimerase